MGFGGFGGCCIICFICKKKKIRGDWDPPVYL